METKPTTNRLAIIVGHSKDSPGAKGVPPLDVHEYVYNSELAKEVQLQAKKIGLVSAIFYRDGKTIGQLGREVNSWCYDYNSCAIELHFDAFGTGTAQGTTTLYDMMPPEGHEFAEVVHEAVAKVFNRKGKMNRGLRWLKMKDRGYYNLYVLQMPACIVEPGFGNNYGDAVLLKEKFFDYAKALAKVANEYLERGKDTYGKSIRP